MENVKTRFLILILLVGLVGGASAQSTISHDTIKAKHTFMLSGKRLREIVQTISAASTHVQSPTAKAVYDFFVANAVGFTAGAGISVTGSYPNFTITNTGDTNAANDITTSTALSGDLSGLLPAPTVVGVQGRPVSSTAPSSNQVLKWNGSAWAPAADATGSGGVIHDATLDGDGSVGTPLKIAQNGATTGQVLKWNGSTWVPFDDATGAAGYTAGTGISITGTVIANTGDLSNTNEIQTLSLAGSNLSISGGNTVALPGSSTNLAVSGTSSPVTLTSDTGTDVTITSGTGVSLSATSTNITVTNTGDTNAGDDLTTSTNFAGDVSGLYNNLQLGTAVVGQTEIATDGVGSAEIATDAVGSAEIAADAVGASELAATTVTPGSYTLASITVDSDGRITGASNGSGGGGSNWTVSGSDIYRNSNASVGTTSVGSAKLHVAGNTATNTILAAAGTMASGAAAFRATGTAGTNAVYGIDTDISAAGGNVFTRTRNSATTGSGNAIHNVAVANGVVGDPGVQFQVEGATNGTWFAGVANQQSDRFVIANAAISGTADLFSIESVTGKVGINNSAPSAWLEVQSPSTPGTYINTIQRMYSDGSFINNKFVQGLDHNGIEKYHIRYADDGYFNFSGNGFFRAASYAYLQGGNYSIGVDPNGFLLNINRGTDPSATSGAMWFNNVDNNLKYRNNSGNVSLAEIDRHVSGTYTAKTANYTLASGELMTSIDATAASRTVTLSTNLIQGVMYGVRTIGNTSNTVTFSGSGITIYIDGDATPSASETAAANATHWIKRYGTNYFISN